MPATDTERTANPILTATTSRGVAHRWLLAAAAVVAVLATDQLSKWIAVNQLLSGPADVPGPFRFRLVANRGALMGFPLPLWALSAAVVLVVIAAGSTLARPSSRRVVLGHGLLVGGAFGNLFDRFQHRPRFPDHAVVDWISSTSLPTFNLADVAIAAGVMLLVASTTAMQPPSTAPDLTVRA